MTAFIVTDRQAEPGDVIFFHGSSFIDTLIRWSQKIRWKDATWNHAGIVVSNTEQSGVKFFEMESNGRISYLNARYAETHMIVRAPVSVDRRRAVEYAVSLIGEPYGYATIFIIFLGLFTPRWFTIDLRRNKGQGTLICSAAVARAWEHGGWTCPSDPFQVSPAQLAEFLGVQS